MVINSHNKKILQTCLFVLVAIVVLGIGYASISAINLIVNGNATASVNQNNFIVHFTEAQNIMGSSGVGGTSVIESDDTKASFNVVGLSKVGDYAEAKYIIKNDSNGIGAEVTLNVTNSNSEFFKVTETIDDNKLQAGDTTLATVKVEMIKTPVTDSVTTSVTAKLIASPLENDSAIGGDSDSKASDDPVSFATDSWSTIQRAVRNNNTSAYNVGDTKIVTINGNNYTLRLANKNTGEHCGDEDTTYSQTACGFVVEFVDVVELRVMNSTNTNEGGYPGSELYVYLQGEFYNKLPNDLRNAIKPTRVISGYGCKSNENPCTNPDNSENNFSSIDNIYLLSGVELVGADLDDKAAGTTTQLEYYKKPNSDRIKQYNGSDAWYWLRSAISISNIDFHSINACGGMSNCSANNITRGGLAPAFRIG